MSYVVTLLMKAMKKEGVITMLSAAEFTRPGASDSGMKLVERVAGKESELKYTEQLLEDNSCRN